ncbi:Uncharacterised protein at_DN0247 [Pycnogonum litorale]
MGKGKEKTPDPQQPQLMAVSTDRLQTMVEEALRRISQDHEVPLVPPEPRPSSAPVDVLASSQPALPELLTRLSNRWTIKNTEKEMKRKPASYYYGTVILDTSQLLMPTIWQNVCACS